MDKVEYREKLDEINELQEEGRFEEAAELADTVDWRKVKSVRTLSMVGGIYNEVQRYEDARRIMKLAYRRSSASKTVLCCLAELAIREGDFDEARRYISEFEDNSPNDTSRFILRYKLLRAQKEPLDDQIAVLREYKDSEYTERWAYELARLYKKNGQKERCIEECDDMILWFSEGKYVYKAMELKQTLTPLTPSQQAKYDAAKKAEAEAKRKAAEEAEEAARLEAEREAEAAEADQVPEVPEEAPERLEEEPAPEAALETAGKAEEDEDAEEEETVPEEHSDEPGFLTDILAEEEAEAQEAEPEETQEEEKPARRFFGRRAAKEAEEKEDRERARKLLDEDEDDEESVPKVKTGEAISRMDNAAEETLQGAVRDEDEKPIRVRRRGGGGGGEKLQTRLLNSFRAVFAGFRAQNVEDDEEEEAEETEAAVEEAAENTEPEAAEVMEAPDGETVPELEPESGSAVSIIAREEEEEAEDLLPEETEYAREELLKKEEAAAEEEVPAEEPDAEAAEIDQAVRDTEDPYAELNLEELFAETGSALATEVASGHYEMADRLKGDDEMEEASGAGPEDMDLLHRTIAEMDRKEKSIDEALAEDDEVPEEEETLENRMADTAVRSAEKPVEEAEEPVPLRETDESLGLTREFNFREEIDRVLFGEDGDKDAPAEPAAQDAETEEEGSWTFLEEEDSGKAETAASEEAVTEEEPESEARHEGIEMPLGGGAAATEGIEPSSGAYGWNAETEEGDAGPAVLSGEITAAEAVEEPEGAAAPEEAPALSIEEAAALGVSEAERLREEAIAEAERVRQEERARAVAEAQAAAEEEARRQAEEARIRAEKRAAEERETEKGLLEAIRLHGKKTGEQADPAGSGDPETEEAITAPDFAGDESLTRQPEEAARVQTAAGEADEVSFTDAELDELVLGVTDEEFIRSLGEDDEETEEEAGLPGEEIPEVPREDVEIYRSTEEEEELSAPGFADIPEEDGEEGLSFNDLEGEDDNEELVRQILDEPEVFTRMEVEGRELTDAERRALGYFAAIPGVGLQTTAAVADVYNNCGDKTSRSGNIIITGRQGSGKTRLADGLIKMICMNINIQAVKVAKVVADTFNTKDPAAVVKKLSGGFLLIEAAGSLSDETIARLNRAMDFRTDDLIVILEDEKQDMDPMLARHPEFAAKFTSTITVPIFTNDELVTFAGTYAAEEGYKLDDMATLALYTMIGENQKDAEPVTVGRVREMVDRAIDKNSRRFRFGRNSDKDKDGGLTVLHEKDFS